MIRNSIVAKLWLTIVGMDIVVLVLLSVLLEQFFDNYVYQLQSRQLVRIATVVESLAEQRGEGFARQVANQLASVQNAQIRFVRDDDPAVRLPSPVRQSTGEAAHPVVLRVDFGGKEYVSVYLRIPGRPHHLLAVSQEMSVSDADIARMRHLILFATVLGVLLATGLAFVVSKNLSRPLVQMNEVAERMAKGQFDVQISVVTNDEVGRLGRTFNQMAGDLKNTIAALSMEKEQLSSILSSLADGVIAADLAGKITLANPPALRWLRGWGRGVVQADADLSHEPKQPMQLPENLQSLVADVVERKSTVVHEIDLHGRTLLVTITPLRDSAGVNLRGVVAVLRDISEERRLERLRKDFIANVSHELRTPLSMLQGYTEALLDDFGDDPVQRRELAEIILDETLRMRRLVNDLLDLAQMESGHFQMTFREFNLVVLLRRVHRKFQTMAQERQVQLKTEFPPDDCSIEGDVGRLEQVFTNLLDNALRHTHAGGEIHIRLFAHPDRVEVQVQDTGSGIPQEDLPYIWERFYKADKARTRGNAGTGLGLAITRHIVTAHGGDVTVASEVGRGTVFTVILPRRVQDSTANGDSAG